MKKIIVFTSLIVFLSSNLYPLFDSNGRSYYNPTFNYIVCHSKKDCLHEIGHSIDDNLRWPSKTRDYRITIGMYFTKVWYLEDERDILTNKIVFYPGFFNVAIKETDTFTLWFWSDGWGGPTELYADMFAWSEGQPERMPEIFRDFYDWELAERLIEKHIGDNDG